MNCAAEVQTALEPQELLNSISKIEKILGRNTKGDYKPRTIDIDIIFYNDLVLENDKLIIPHKKAHLRKFVLEPICEIRPDLIHPVLNKTVSDILNELGADQYVRQIGKYY
ncbi:MAG: 2-amino-4-hydroxy-6-hydroxymethyldihydropteridine diphosphokinase [Candidatus Dadabacteria bacterium]|nr:2-amino-4-hydroxy-6-hydroxymethyldihydropteridine diphosphokinase [Candidatus Dadabacteria bacterium]